MSETPRPLFPFTAIVGQETMKLALLLNAIDPLIGGVLVMGTRGTAKSTAVRALAAVLPAISGPSGAIPTPFVNLPVGATEDRVLGTLDIEKALQEGRRRFEPGLLAQAHRGILYIDEVNLLPDHLVDIILDTVAMGVNQVERDGISFVHEARVILVGTMNPEEGELRPQLLDRFGLCATAEALSDAAVRKEAMKRRLAFDAEPQAFGGLFAGEQQVLADRIANARRMLPDVVVADFMLDRIVEKAAEAGADGLRADLALHRASRALAAWNGRHAVTEADLEAVAELALAHRRRKRERSSSPQPPARPPAPYPPPQGKTHEPPRVDRKHEESSKVVLHGFGNAPLVPWADRAAPRPSRGRRSFVSGRGRGAETSASGLARVSAKPTSAIAFPETIRIAGLRRCGRLPLTPLAIAECMWRSRQRKRRRLVVFVVDASGSMAAAARMRAAKAAALGLLEKAYRNRSFIALIAFRNKSAEVLLAPTRSAFRAFQQLRELPAGGATPLAEGLRAAADLIHRAVEKDPGLDPFIVLITDGRATYPANGFLEAQRLAAELGEARYPCLCIDTETGPVRLRQTAILAELLAADHVNTDDLPPSTWAPIIGEWLSSAKGD